MKFNDLIYITWIPTNNCKLNKNKIFSKILENDILFEEINKNILKIYNPFTLEFSCSLNKIFEMGIGYEILMNFNDNSHVEILQNIKFKQFCNFDLTVYFKENKNDNNKNYFIKFQGKIFFNGLFEFEIIDMNNINYVENLPNIIYTIIRKIIHGKKINNQYSKNCVLIQKKSVFKFNNIANYLINEMEKLEHHAKILVEKKFNFPDFKTVEDLKCQAKFYNMYLKSFLFCFKDYLDKGDDYIKTSSLIIESIEIMYNRLKNKIENIKYKYGLFLTIIMLIVSANILIKNISFDLNFNFNKLITVELFIILISVYLSYFKLEGNPLNNFYKIKEKILNYLIYYERNRYLKPIIDSSIINFFCYKLKYIKFLFYILFLIDLLFFLIDKQNLIIIYSCFIIFIISVDYIFFKRKIKNKSCLKY